MHKYGGNLSLYFSELCGDVHGPLHFAPDERVEQILHWLEEQTFRAHCVDEDTNEWLAHATLSTSHGEVLDKRSRLNERSVHDGDILFVILWAAVGPTFVCEWSNGIRVGPAPPLPREGCYVRQLIRKVWQSTKLPWYAENPIDGCVHCQIPIHDGLDCGTVFGPVHAVVDARATHGLISACVPAPLCCLPSGERNVLPKLIWINFSTSRNPQGVLRHFDSGHTRVQPSYHRVSHHFCETVAASEVAQWRVHGWYDCWHSCGAFPSVPGLPSRLRPLPPVPRCSVEPVCKRRRV